MDCSSQDFPVSAGDCYLITSPIASSFSFCLQQSSPASESFPMSWLFVPVGPSIGASASASVLPMHIQGWFSLGLTDLISLLRKGLSRVFSSTTIQKHQFFGTQLLMVQLSYVYMTTGKSIALTAWKFVGKVVSLLFNMLSRFVIAFLLRSKCLLISWQQSQSTVILEHKKIKSVTVAIFFPIYLPWSDWIRCCILVFWMLSFKPAFSLSSFTFIKRFFSSSSFSAIRVVSSVYLKLWIFLLEILIPACASSSPVFLMMYSAYKLNSRMTIYSLDVLLPQFGYILLFHATGELVGISEPQLSYLWNGENNFYLDSFP